MAASITYNGQTYDLATPTGMSSYKAAIDAAVKAQPANQQVITGNYTPPAPTATAPLGSSAYTQQLLTAGNTLGTASSVKTGIPYTPITYNVPPTETPKVELPADTATNTNDAYFTSLATEAANARKALEDTYKKQIADIQTKQAEAQKKIDAFTAKQESIVGPGGSVDQLTQPFRQQLETSERERLKVEENYFANQKLTNELDSLLTEGNTLIQQVKGVTGLAGIRNPRINQAIDTVNARVGVISAVMSARSGQIAEAYRLIDRSMGAITADRQDRLNYYESLFNFYGGLSDKEGQKLVALNNDEKDYLSAQIGLLQNDLAQAQKNADYIKGLMVNPESAGFMASAGVTLNDTPAEVNAKLAAETTRREIDSFKNERVAEGYEYVPFPTAGQDVVQFAVGGQTLSFIEPPLKTTAGTYTERLNEAVNEAIALAGEELEGSVGEDGYVDPGVYMKLRTDFSALTGGKASIFDATFASRLSPQERARLGLGKAVGQEAVPENEEIPSWLNG